MSGQIYSSQRAAGAQAVNRTIVSSLAFLVWDILITTDDEVSRMWPKPWSAIKVLYFIVRYAPLLIEVSVLFVGTELTPSFHFTPHDCFIWSAFQPAAAVAIALATDIILVLRLRALYHTNCGIKIFLNVLYALELCCMVVGLVLSTPGVQYDEICFVTKAPPGFLVSAGAAVVFQTVLFVLTCWKFLESIRAGWGNVPLVQLLIRDGTWAFFLLFFILLAEVALYASPNSEEYSSLLYGWLLTAFSFAGYRILLNMSSARLSPPLPSTNFELSSTVRFSRLSSFQPSSSGQSLRGPR